MVEFNEGKLDSVFRALADPTRRGIITMLVDEQQKRIVDLAEPFEMSLAAVLKHVRVLERAELVTRFKRGRENFLQLNPEPLKEVNHWLDFYEKFWTRRFAQLEHVIEEESKKSK